MDSLSSVSVMEGGRSWWMVMDDGVEEERRADVIDLSGPKRELPRQISYDTFLTAGTSPLFHTPTSNSFFLSVQAAAVIISFTAYHFSINSYQNKRR